MSIDTSVTVVIPNWNRSELLRTCLTALGVQTQSPTRVIVVDNGSTDDSVEMVHTEFPAVEVIALPENTGFSPAVHVGIAATRTAFVALLNNDAVPAGTWLEELTACAARDSRLGSVNPKLLRLVDGEPSRLIDTFGDQYSIWGRPFPSGRDTVDAGQYDSGHRIFSASGGASLYRVDMLRQIGNIDRRFVAYYEDTDLGFRSRLAGWEVGFCPAAVVYHHVGATSGGSREPLVRRLVTKNILVVYVKNMPWQLALKYLPLFVVTLSLQAANCLRRGQIRAWLGGWGDFLRLLPEVLRDRRVVQAQRTIPLRELDAALWHGLAPRR